MIEHYQNVVIGSGEAGKLLAWDQARLGERTICVERGLLGGACPNVACLPSKNVIYSAKVASLVAHAADFGISSGSTKVDMAGVFRRKQNMVDRQHQVHLDLFKASGAELLMGEARFTGPKAFRVTAADGASRELQGDRVFLATGTRASVPPVPGLADAQPMTHVETLNLQRLPEHLVVFGGGFVGLEFAQAMRRFGSRVTIVQRAPQLLEHEDADVSEALAELMRDEGIDVQLNTNLLSVTGRSGDRLELQLRSGDSARALEATDILVATGRTPNTDRLDVEKGGVQLDPHGYIQVNERLETTAPGVWAMGECAGSPKFTHIGNDDHRIVRDNLAGGNRTTRNRLIPYCLFTDPELARVGLSESAARAQSVPYRLAKIPAGAILRTNTHGEKRGFVKALIAGDNRILGFTAFAAEASELLATVQTAMLAGASYTMLRDGIFAHPTTAEGLIMLFANVPPLNQIDSMTPKEKGD